VSSLETQLASSKKRQNNMQDDIDEGDAARSDLKQQIQELNDKIIEMEQEKFEMDNQHLEMLNQLKELEYKLTITEEKMEELIRVNEMLEKNQAIYIAKKYDKVDKALGTYLNKFPERDSLKIMFLRESEGVYQFGQKRVYVKIENGDQIFVRVGGGYLHIDEFIYTYTQQEVDKLDRRDVLNRFQNKT